MSRGLGRLQKAILDQVNEHGLTTVESIRWTVREEDDDMNLGFGDINAVKRAVESLVARSRVKHTERPLQSIDECIAHYPGKTLKAAIRRLRIDLLPALREPSPGRGSHLRYTLADNEKFHFASLPEV